MPAVIVECFALELEPGATTRVKAVAIGIVRWEPAIQVWVMGELTVVQGLEGMVVIALVVEEAL